LPAFYGVVVFFLPDWCRFLKSDETQGISLLTSFNSIFQQVVSFYDVGLASKPVKQAITDQ
jgi:hypothetical protein